MCIPMWIGVPFGSKNYGKCFTMGNVFWKKKNILGVPHIADSFGIFLAQMCLSTVGSYALLSIRLSVTWPVARQVAFFFLSLCKKSPMKCECQPNEAFCYVHRSILKSHCILTSRAPRLWVLYPSDANKNCQLIKLSTALGNAWVWWLSFFVQHRVVMDEVR